MLGVHRCASDAHRCQPIRDHYVRVLGFEKAEGVTAEPTFALVLRDGFGLYLSENLKRRSKIAPGMLRSIKRRLQAC